MAAEESARSEQSGISKDKLCAATGISQQQLKQAIADGFVSKPKMGQFVVAPALVGIIKFLSSEIGKAGNLPAYGSMAQCAAQAHVPISVQREAKRKGCTAFKWGRVDLSPLLEWVFSKGDESENWPDRLKRAEALIKELALSKAQQQTIEFATVDKFLLDIIHGAFFGELERLQLTMPSLLKGRPELEIHNFLKDEVDKIKSGLKARLGQMMGDKTETSK